MVSSTKHHHGGGSPLKKRSQLLSPFSSSRRVRKISSTTVEAEASFSKLKHKLKEVERECVNLMNLLMNIPQEVKVEKIEEDEIHVKITCEKGGDHKLVSILEAFEQMGLDVVEAKVSCDFWFAMEAVVVTADQDSEASTIDVRLVTQTILNAIDTSR